jgi:GT2 family glycosyltransferase
MKILVVVPTLGRRPELLRKAFESITSQAIADIDIVAVAPCGRGVESLVTEFGGRFVADPASGGQSGAINAGIAAAREGTTYFAWLCDDDLLTPGSLRATTSALATHPEATVAFGWCDYIDNDDRVVFRSRAGRVAASILRWGPNLVPQPGSLMRLADVVAVGGVDETATVTMDLDLFLRLRQRGRFVALRQTLACFRWHEDSLIVSGEKFSMEQADQVRMKYMSPLGARAYNYLRWPGRGALWLAKRRVDHNTARAATRR